MAERRMFAKTIIDSDAFLDMPLTAQCLYLHLSMRADDEGFVNSPQRIVRLIGATEDDLECLIYKKFILSFDSGVVVIKHWKINNYIRKDRLVETMYKEEKQQLREKGNGAYTLEGLDAKTQRKIAYQNSELPYSFSYKIRQYFDHQPCPICHYPMDNYERGIHRPSIQHNIPISLGGKHELDNISVICHSCNVSIRNKETGKLNNEEVKKAWADICQSEVSIGKVSIGKNSLGKVNLGKDNISADKAAPTTQKRFKKPTIEEIQAYCQEKELEVDSQRFYDYYESNGWKVGKNPMKDWKATLRNWQRNDKNYSKKSKIPDFSEVDYSQPKKTDLSNTYERLFGKE